MSAVLDQDKRDKYGMAHPTDLSGFRTKNHNDAKMRSLDKLFDAKKAADQDLGTRLTGMSREQLKAHFRAKIK